MPDRDEPLEDLIQDIAALRASGRFSNKAIARVRGRISILLGKTSEPEEEIKGRDYQRYNVSAEFCRGLTERYQWRVFCYLAENADRPVTLLEMEEQLQLSHAAIVGSTIAIRRHAQSSDGSLVSENAEYP